MTRHHFSMIHSSDVGRGDSWGRCSTRGDSWGKADNGGRGDSWGKADSGGRGDSWG